MSFYVDDNSNISEYFPFFQEHVQDLTVKVHVLEKLCFDWKQKVRLNLMKTVWVIVLCVLVGFF